VPRIAARSREGLASTWIGAESPFRAGMPFIQVGVVEQRFPWSGVEGVPRPPDRYLAFWSTTSARFHALSLFTVRPGDRIAARLTHAGGLWHVVISDATSGRARSFSTSEDASGSFDQAEWLQEDVTNALTKRLFIYPAIIATKFSALAVNGSPPESSVLYSQWMAPRDIAGYIGPGPLRDDAFATKAATLGTQARRYLTLLVRSTAAARAFQLLIVESSDRPPATLRSAAARYAVALRSTIDALARTRWPARVRRLIAQQVAHADGLLAISTPPQAASAYPRWRERFLASGAALIFSARRLDRALGAPALW
jgi:hypothetical protein